MLGPHASPILANRLCVWTAADIIGKKLGLFLTSFTLSVINDIIRKALLLMKVGSVPFCSNRVSVTNATNVGSVTFNRVRGADIVSFLITGNLREFQMNPLIWLCNSESVHMELNGPYKKYSSVKYYFTI